MSWLPIESAPRTDEVLLYWPEWKPARGRRGYELSAMIRVGRVYETPGRPPTHWQPLPEPPTDDRWELTEAGRAMRGGK